MTKEKSMFEKVKKQNGEMFAKTIRAYDNGIFDVPNLDKVIKFAGRKAEPLMNYLVSLKKIKIEEHGVYKDPIGLLREAGYVAYYADTLEKQNKIKPFYAPGEELCTFRDPQRYKEYHIINAVKKNVSDIRRKDFTSPEREDEYGTSVISIQVLKTGGFISIKNRYNHTVANPDNTFNSNPDNIIPGLAESIKHHFNVDFSSKKERLPEGYTQFGDQIVKYKYELENIYFGENFYAKDGVVHEIDKAKELMLGNFILNLSSREIKNPSEFDDGFVEALSEEISGEDKKLQVTVNEEGHKCLQVNGVSILELDRGEIVAVNFPHVQKIGNGFLFMNEGLKEISLPEVKEIGGNFLSGNKELKAIRLPKVERIGDRFLSNNEDLQEISLPEVKEIGGNFLSNNKKLHEIRLPEVEKIGDNFLSGNRGVNEISLPGVKEIGNDFLFGNKELKEIRLPKVEKIGDNFLYHNQILKEINLPQVVMAGYSFLYNNKELKAISLPEVEKIDTGFLFNNEKLNEISLPKAEKIGDNFLYHNQELKEINLPQVVMTGYSFLYNNKELKAISLPEVRVIGNGFLSENQELKEISLPEVEKIGDNFLFGNRGINEISLPKANYIGDGFLHENQELKEISLPNVKKVGRGFLDKNSARKKAPLSEVNIITKYSNQASGR